MVLPPVPATFQPRTTGVAWTVASSGWQAEEAVRFSILGPLEVSGPEGPVALAGKRRRALLVRLLVSPNLPVAVDTLCEDGWDGAPAAGTESTLHSHLSTLRQRIGPGRLQSAGGSVVLRVGPGELDTELFERAVAHGTEALRAGDPVGALDHLDEALALWRGPALADVAGSAWALPEQARLDELRIMAMEAALDARLRLGGHAEVVAPAERLLAEHPYRERVAAQLMLALYRCGRQAEALAVYQRTRLLLDEELGLAPGPELRELEEAILLHQPHLDLNSRAVVAVDAPPVPAAPVPAALAHEPLAGMIGRDVELAGLADAVKRAATGEGRQVVLVAGEAGQGKSTLVAAAARQAAADGAVVLFGHAEEDLVAPYGLFAEALGHYVGSAARPEVERLAAAHGPALARLVPALGSPAGHAGGGAADPESERYLLFAAVVGALAELCAGRPAVLVLDDLQWADRGSLQLLRHVASAHLPLRLAVLATYRDDELSHRHPLTDTLAALHRLPGVTRLLLPGLDDEGVVSFLEAMAGSSLDAKGVALAHAVHRETDGNPFFVGELLRHLSETGVIAADPDGLRVAPEGLERSGLPETVRLVVGARVGRMGADAEQLLATASVLGRVFDLGLLAAVSAEAEERILDLLDRAAAASLVRAVAGRPGHFTFVHALIQRTLYDDLGPTRAARLHRRVAEALEATDPERLEELARHWAAADPPDLQRAVAAAQRAADAALAALAPADAGRLYGRALALWARTAERDPVVGLDLRIGLGTAQRQTGDPAFGATLLDAARRAASLGEVDRLAAAALANDRGFTARVGAVDVERVAVLEEVLDRLPADHPERPLVTATLCQELTFGAPLERRRQLADDAIAGARAAGDRARLCRVLTGVSVPVLVPAMATQVLDLSAEALSLAEETGDPVLLFWAASRRHVAAASVADVEEMDRCLGIAGALAERLDQPTLLWAQHVHLATRALIAGDVDRAEQQATAAHQIGTHSGQPDADLFFRSQIMVATWQRGGLAGLVPLIEQAAAEHPGLPVLEAVLTAALAMAGDDERARARLDGRAEAGFDLPMDLTWTLAMVTYAEAAIDCRHLDAAAVLFELLAPWADRLAHINTSTTGPVALVLGGLADVLGRPDEAVGHYAASAALCRRMGARFFAAHTDGRWGDMLIRRGRPGDRVQAAELLARAREAAVAAGYGGVAARAEASLARLG